MPLFVEEVTRLLLERGVEGGAQAIPPTLQQSLAARLDRLGRAREVALIGAVVGRGFTFPLLAVLAGGDGQSSVAAVTDRAGLSEAALQGALDSLAEAHLLIVEAHKAIEKIAAATRQPHETPEQAYTRVALETPEDRTLFKAYAVAPADPPPAPAPIDFGKTARAISEGRRLASDPEALREALAEERARPGWWQS